MRKLIILVLFVSLMSSIPAPVTALSGSEFNPGRIIDDAVFNNANSMTVAQVQQFLNAKVPNCDNWGTRPYAGTTRRAYSEARGIVFPLTCLKDYHENPSNFQNNLEGRPIPAGAKSAAQIIWEAGQAYSINPQVLIALISREQGLITDDWPWPVQFKSATGYACPDTGPNHSINCQGYEGLYTQVTKAAWQFRRYATFPNEYNYVAGRTNTIPWSPQPSCGTSGVYIENQATASLYNYAPYRPNQAALNNLYGTGDDCSSYANRNFWRDFRDWFGSTTGFDLVVAAADDGGPQYVINSGRKFLIPDVPTKIAWGLHTRPTVTLPASQIYNTPEGNTLNRAVRSEVTGQFYMIDGGKRYPVDNPQLFNSWGMWSVHPFPYYLVNAVPDGPSYLTPIVQAPSDGRVFVADGGKLRYIPSLASLKAWGGDAPVLITPSTDLFNSIAIDSNQAESYKVSYGGKKYIINHTGYYDLPDSLEAAYPGITTPTTLSTLQRLRHLGTATPLVQQVGHGEVYLTNGDSRYHVPTLDLLHAWSPNRPVQVTMLNSGHLSFGSNGSSLSTYLAHDQSNGKVYIMDGQKREISNALENQFTTGKTVIDYKGINNFSSGSAMSPLVQPTNSGAVYLIDDGKRYHVNTLHGYIMWGGTQQPQTFISPGTAAMYADSGTLGQHFSVGSTSYWLGDSNKAYSLDSRAANHWPAQNPTALSSATLNRLTNAGTLPVNFAISGGHCVIRSQQLFCTDNSAQATTWGLLNTPALSRNAIAQMPMHALTNFVYSNSNSAIGISMLDTNKLIHIHTPTQVFNMGFRGEAMVPIDATDIATRTLVSDWNGVLVKNGTDYYAFDAGTKRKLNDQAKQTWTNNETVAVTATSNELLSFFRNGSDLTRSFQAQNDGKIYGVTNIQRRHIWGWDTFTRDYAPLTPVSGLLRDSMVEGEHL